MASTKKTPKAKALEEIQNSENLEVKALQEELQAQKDQNAQIMGVLEQLMKKMTDLETTKATEKKVEEVSNSNSS